MRKQQAIQALLEQKLLPLFYNDSAETSIAILRALYDAGIRTVEYTNRGENALTNFIEMKKTEQFIMTNRICSAMWHCSYRTEIINRYEQQTNRSVWGRNSFLQASYGPA